MTEVTAIPMEHGLILAAVLFALGFAGVLVRRNIIFMLMSIEVMMNSAALAFVVAGSRWQQADEAFMTETGRTSTDFEDLRDLSPYLLLEGPMATG